MQKAPYSFAFVFERTSLSEGCEFESHQGQWDVSRGFILNCCTQLRYNGELLGIATGAVIVSCHRWQTRWQRINKLQMLVFPNALCCSLYERNCVCAVTKIFTKFLPANNFCQLLRVTHKRSCTSAGNAQAQLHFRDDQQRAFGKAQIWCYTNQKFIYLYTCFVKLSFTSCNGCAHLIELSHRYVSQMVGVKQVSCYAPSLHVMFSTTTARSLIQYRRYDRWRQCPAVCAGIVAISIVLCQAVCVRIKVCSGPCFWNSHNISNSC